MPRFGNIIRSVGRASGRHSERGQDGKFVKKVLSGEKTGAQHDAERGSTRLEEIFLDQRVGLVTGFEPTPPATYATYRKCAQYPTCQLAINKLVNVMIGSPWVWKLKSESMPKRWLDASKDVFDPMREETVRNAMFAMTYGLQFGEQVYKGWNVEEIKPLEIESTNYLTDDDGKIVGIQNRDCNGTPTDLPMAKAFVFVSDSEGGDPLGHPRTENIREPWHQCRQILAKSAIYNYRASDTIPICHYPEGTSKDASGADRENSLLARQLVARVLDGLPAVVPNKFAAMIGEAGDSTAASAMFEKALKCAGLSDWILSFTEPKGPDRNPGFIERLQLGDQYIIRGWGLPDKVVLPSNRGMRQTKEMDDNSADLASQLKYGEFCRQFRKQVIDPWAVLNFGEGARGAIIVDAPPLSLENNSTLEKIVLALLANPATAVKTAKILNLPEVCHDLHVKTVAALEPTWEDDDWAELGQKNGDMAGAMTGRLSKTTAAAKNGNGKH